MTFKELQALKKDIQRITEKYGGHNIKVFGSVAHDMSKQSSDIDLLIDLEKGRTLLDIVAIKQDLEEFLKCEVDIVTKNSLNPYLRDAILKSAINL